MTHLDESQFIDILLGEPRSAKIDQHLESCDLCQQQMDVLRKGMLIAQVGEPDISQVRYPKINYSKFRRKAIWTRVVWGAAAAMFLISLLGFRFESNQGSWSFELSLLGNQKQSENQQIAALEKRLMEVIDVNTQLTQAQLDARFNAIYEERTEELGSFRDAVVSGMERIELDNNRQLIAVRDEFKGDLERMKLEGKLK